MRKSKDHEAAMKLTLHISTTASCREQESVIRDHAPHVNTHNGGSSRADRDRQMRPSHHVTSRIQPGRSPVPFQFPDLYLPEKNAIMQRRFADAKIDLSEK